MAKRIGHAKAIGKTEYKYVYEMQHTCGGKPNYFHGKVVVNRKFVKSVSAPTAKECAVKIDMELIKMGLSPINILKKK